MGLAIIHCRAQLGVAAPPVTIEVFLSGGLPSFSIVGMAETAVRESKDRVRGALLSSGFDWPQQRMTVSLGPAELRKSGGRYDLPIALGILAARKQFPASALDSTEVYGELSLSGELRPVTAMLPAALAAKKVGRTVILPTGNVDDTSLADVRALPARTLIEVVKHLTDETPIQVPMKQRPKTTKSAVADLIDVKGQQQAKRALEVAAAGGHNLLFVGPPGTGKSMLARRLPGILPPLDETDALETAAIESLFGATSSSRDWRQRPFRAPHHTASAAALVGGGRQLLPGEISRAHHGVLFLDELPEFNRRALEVLREPMETGAITIARANGTVEYPAEFQTIAAMNPCPCGYHGDPQADCRCSADRVASYRQKVSGPLLDRFDLHLDVLRPTTAQLRCVDTDSEASAAVRDRVAMSALQQQDRQGVCNARLSGAALEQHCGLSSKCWTLLDRAAKQFNLSARAHHRALRVARTIADLNDSADIQPEHIAESLALRCLDR